MTIQRDITVKFSFNQSDSQGKHEIDNFNCMKIYFCNITLFLKIVMYYGT